MTKKQAAKAAIIAHLTPGKFCNTKQLQDDLLIKTNTLKNALSELMEEGKLTRTKPTGSKFHYYFKVRP